MSDAQRYRVLDRIAAGGMAEVYLGESAGIEGFRKKVAIKRVLPKLSANSNFINMFLDEARLCAYLNHSRCVQVFDIGQSGGSHFIVMEYVDGADLKQVIEYLAARRRVLPLPVACHIALQICEGLAYAHGALDHDGQPLHIVHRDVSPQNVLMTRYGEVKLVDFGLARASSHLAAEDEDIVKGKFGYLAPEITRGQGADHRADLFAAGILLWEMLAGRSLFLGRTDQETFQQVRAAQVPDIRRLRPDVSEDLARVLVRALERDRARRYQTADELARDLAATLLGLGHPVTYQDLAAIIRSVADERDQRRRSGAEPANELLGDLIVEALHEFSAELPSTAAAAPLGTQGRETVAVDYVDPATWGLDDEPAPPPAKGDPWWRRWFTS